MNIPAGSVVVTEKDAGGTIHVPMYRRVVIRLPGNSTTGYVWAYDEPSAKVRKDAKDYQRDFMVTPHFDIRRRYEGPDESQSGEPATPGRGGTFVFAIRARESGLYELKFVYVRPWIPERKAKTFTVKLNLHL